MPKIDNALVRSRLICKSQDSKLQDLVNFINLKLLFFISETFLYHYIFQTFSLSYGQCRWILFMINYERYTDITKYEHSEYLLVIKINQKLWSWIFILIPQKVPATETYRCNNSEMKVSQVTASQSVTS